MGMSAAAGVAVTVGVVAMIITPREVLVLLWLALFLAIGLELLSIFVVILDLLPVIGLTIAGSDGVQ
jgi:hypothetical protein